MATEPVDPDIDHWLDGLAGRPGEGQAHAEGERLRRAFQPEAPAVAPKLSWAQIEARAAAPLTAAEPPHALAAPTTGGAANDKLWRPWHGWAAAVLVAACVGLVLRQPDPEPVLRGNGGTAAVWVVPDPDLAAQGLAAELRVMGATVAVQAEGRDRVLQVAATGAAAAAVNQRLAALETSLDGTGRLTLRLRAR